MLWIRLRCPLRAGKLRSMRLLLVEDSSRLAAALLSSLGDEGLAVDHAADGRVALRQIEAHEYDLMILDLMLPQVSGSDVLRALRASQVPTRVLVLSACDQTEDRVAALNLGADDYLVKPFQLSELKARIFALLRRRYGETSGVLAHGAAGQILRTCTLRAGSSQCG